MNYAIALAGFHELSRIFRRSREAYTFMDMFLKLIALSVYQQMNTTAPEQ